jgi:presqualene diphosphate synthase
MTLASHGDLQETAPEVRAIEQRASGSSFYLAMRLMPRAQREAMFAIYAFCRAVDDIADDGDGTPSQQREQLQAWRDDIEALYTGKPARLTAFLVEPVGQYRLKKDDFLAVIDGMEMDVDDAMNMADLARLDLYCDRVASAVGRLSVRVFGMDEVPGIELAHHLGRALQLTNVLRDLDEDAAMGRLYLPSEFLVEADIESRSPSDVIADPSVDLACRLVAKMARTHYEAADRILNSSPTGMLRAPRLMSAVYSKILEKMEAVGWAPPRARAKIRKRTLLLILLRYGLSG